MSESPVPAAPAATSQPTEAPSPPWWAKVIMAVGLFAALQVGMDAAGYPFREWALWARIAGFVAVMVVAEFLLQIVMLRARRTA